MTHQFIELLAQTVAAGEGILIALGADLNVGADLITPRPQNVLLVDCSCFADQPLVLEVIDNFNAESGLDIGPVVPLGTASKLDGGYVDLGRQIIVCTPEALPDELAPAHRPYAGLANILDPAGNPYQAQVPMTIGCACRFGAWLWLRNASAATSVTFDARLSVAWDIRSHKG